MLEFKNLFRTAYKSILKNKMRSLLTSLGIIIGVGSVIVMVSIGEGAQAQIEENIRSLGTDLIMVQPGDIRRGGVSRGAGTRTNLTLKDVEMIRNNAQYIKAVSPVINSSGQIIGNGENWNTQFYGVSQDYFEIKSWEIEHGKFFTEKDIKSRRKVCVLGNTVVEELFNGQNPVGQKVRVRNVPFTVIGTLKEKGQTSFGPDQDDLILAPYTTVLYRLKGAQLSVDMIHASAISTPAIDQAQEEIRTILRQQHGLQGDAEDDFYVRNQSEITETATQTTEVLTAMLAAVAGVSLIVGGIGIMNIMLVSVKERTREIGIRLSIGARPIDILAQFLTEAVVISLIGGLIGIVLAFIVSSLIQMFSGFTTVIQPAIILISVGFAMGIGIFFGFYPARKASELNPIDALRYE
ncbi:ABC transporter permease [Chloroherpeton thalassium]|uniref:ABC transporter permease n=1 Tax=Chloroherpeton thalassium TaxID=100716 RepID=UPI001B7FAF3B|nr:ABC transporter permease [Chloroherpeton thalassium]